jgi:hypothetical protein
VGERINQESERLMAMSQFPGLEEEAAKASENIRRLYEEAEEVLEGKKYAEIMREAFKELEEGKVYSGNLIDKLRRQHFDVGEFIRYLEVKFRPRNVIKEGGRRSGDEYF